MAETETLTLDEIERLSQQVLEAPGTTPDNARPLARATAETEALGVASHGLADIPIHCEHVRCGKVEGRARPMVETPKPGVVHIDVATGFAHLAIEAGFDAFVAAARDQGIAALALFNSYNCVVLGVHTARLAAEGLLGMGFTNAPALIAPSRGHPPGRHQPDLAGRTGPGRRGGDADRP